MFSKYNKTIKCFLFIISEFIDLKKMQNGKNCKMKCNNLIIPKFGLLDQISERVKQIKKIRVNKSSELSFKKFAILIFFSNNKKIEKIRIARIAFSSKIKVV